LEPAALFPVAVVAVVALDPEALVSVALALGGVILKAFDCAKIEFRAVALSTKLTRNPLPVGHPPCGGVHPVLLSVPSTVLPRSCGVKFDLSCSVTVSVSEIEERMGFARMMHLIDQEDAEVQPIRSDALPFQSV
jgi:hypothetical protein